MRKEREKRRVQCLTKRSKRESVARAKGRNSAYYVIPFFSHLTHSILILTQYFMADRVGMLPSTRIGLSLIISTHLHRAAAQPEVHNVVVLSHRVGAATAGHKDPNPLSTSQSARRSSTSQSTSTRVFESSLLAGVKACSS
jgi:hypothetical protein